MSRLLIERCERLCNRCVEASTTATEEARALEGRSFAVRVEGLGLEVTMAVRGGRVTLDDHVHPDASAVLRGGPLDLLRLLPTDDDRSLAARLKTTAATLTGKVEVAERFAKLLRHAWPDLEEELAGWIGDVAAHEIGRAAGGVGEWLRRAAEAARLDTAEYLQEEARVLPSPYEVRAFCAGVERLRDDVERAAQRLERLERATPGRDGGAAERSG